MGNRESVLFIQNVLMTRFRVTEYQTYARFFRISVFISTADNVEWYFLGLYQTFL